jgi:hypothetical protein
MWGNEPRLTGSIIPARTPQQWAFTELKPDKRRVLIEQNGAEYRLTNGLGVALSQLRWRSGDNQLWLADAVAAGETVTLERAANVSTEHDYLLPNDWQRLPQTAGIIYAQWQKKAHVLTATTDALMDPLPGPVSVDTVNPTSFVLCVVAVQGEASTNETGEQP